MNFELAIKTCPLHTCFACFLVSFGTYNTVNQEIKALGNIEYAIKRNSGIATCARSSVSDCFLSF